VSGELLQWSYCTFTIFTNCKNNLSRISYSSRRTLIAGKEEREPAGIETDTGTGSFVKYQSWKKTLEPDDLQPVDFFEKDFLKKATRLVLPPMFPRTY
jgi:hypothetical protein